jgi:hypothetical protein
MISINMLQRTETPRLPLEHITRVKVQCWLHVWVLSVRAGFSPLGMVVEEDS